MAQQHRIARGTQDESPGGAGSAPLALLGWRNDCHPAREYGCRPMAAQMRQEADQNHRILCPGGVFLDGGRRSPSVRGAFENEQGR